MPEETPIEVTVQRDDQREQYFAEVAGQRAHLDFKPAGPGVLDFRHTEVPPELRGHGIAERLVRGALDDARRRGDHVIPTCPFVRRFLARHPDYGDLVAGPPAPR
jgi:predicted GNAT family acetyltransferase